eukprot:UN03965
MSTIQQKPEDFINAITGRPVIIKLTGGSVVKGILVSIDTTMSCVIEQFERFDNGELVSSYEKAYLRGSNILYFGINRE